MKKLKKKPKEFLKDINELLDLANELDDLDLDNFNEVELKKRAENLEKKITQKYSKYLPEEDLDTEE